MEDLAASEGLRQSKWIRRRLAHADRMRGSYRINNLVNIKESDAKAKNRIQAAVVNYALPPYQQSESYKVCQALCVLSGVHGPYTEREEAGKNTRHGWMWTCT
jgi:hypothetical protein